MRRTLLHGSFTIVAALSLVSFGGVVAIWVRSHRVADTATCEHTDVLRATWVWHYLHNSTGQLYLARHHIVWPSQSAAVVATLNSSPPAVGWQWSTTIPSPGFPAVANVAGPEAN